MEKDLKAAFDAPTSRGDDYDYDDTTAQQIVAMQKLIKKWYGINIQYKEIPSSLRGDPYLRYVKPGLNDCHCPICEESLPK